MDKHALGNMIYNLENRKNLKRVEFTKDAVRDVLSYLKELEKQTEQLAELKAENERLQEEMYKMMPYDDCQEFESCIYQKVENYYKQQLTKTQFDTTEQICENIRKTLADNEYIYSFINPKNKNKANMDGYFDCQEEIKDALEEIERGATNEDIE